MNVKPACVMNKCKSSQVKSSVRHKEHLTYDAPLKQQLLWIR